MSEAPLTDLQIALSKCVDLARVLPVGSVNDEYVALVAIYFEQVASAVVGAKS